MPPLPVMSTLRASAHDVRHNISSTSQMLAPILVVASVLTVASRYFTEASGGTPPVGAAPLPALAMSFALSVAGSAVVFVALLVAIQASQLRHAGETVDLARAWSAVGPRVGAALVAQALVGLAIVAVLLPAIAAFTGAALLAPDVVDPESVPPEEWGPTAAYALGGALLALAALPVVLIFIARWPLAGPIALLEEKDAVSALRRSWNLTRGHGMQALGLVLLVAFLGFIATAILAMPGSLLMAFTPPSFAPVISAASQFVASLVVVPLSAQVFWRMHRHLAGLDVPPVATSISPAAPPAGLSGP